MSNTPVTFEEVYENKYIRDSVRAVAKTAVKAYPALGNYYDEITQDLWIAISKAIPKYDPDKVSIGTFFRHVIDRRKYNVIKRYMSMTNNDVVSLDDLSGNDLVDAHNSIRLLCLKMDLQVVFEMLSPVEKRICKHLMNGESITRIARHMRISPSDLLEAYIRPIRQKFKENMLDRYLDKSDSFYM